MRKKILLIELPESCCKMDFYYFSESISNKILVILLKYFRKILIFQNTNVIITKMDFKEVFFFVFDKPTICSRLKTFKRKPGMLKIWKTPKSEIPHGTIPLNFVKSGFTLTANPCIVTPFENFTPIAAIFCSEMLFFTQTPMRSLLFSPIIPIFAP